MLENECNHIVYNFNVSKSDVKVVTSYLIFLIFDFSPRFIPI